MFTEKAANDEERYETLRGWLQGDNYLLPTRDLVECYFDWEKSGRTAFPFPGGRLDQPEWVLKVFKTLERVQEFYRLKAKVIKNTALPEFNPSMFGK